MARAAVERQFEIVGEALSQLAKLDASLATRISEYRRIIAFRTSSFTAMRKLTTSWSGISSNPNCRP
jgi:hypothetical protein